jgi:hypothetical protein
LSADVNPPLKGWQLDQGNPKQIHTIYQHNQKPTTQKLDCPKTITLAGNQVSTIHKSYCYATNHHHATEVQVRTHRKPHSRKHRAKLIGKEYGTFWCYASHQ